MSLHMGVTPISGTAHVLLLTFIIAAPQPRCPSIVFLGRKYGIHWYPIPSPGSSYPLAN